MLRKCRIPDGAGKVTEMKILLQMLIVPPTPTCPKTLIAPYTMQKTDIQKKNQKKTIPI